MSLTPPDMPRMPDIPEGTENCGCCEGVETQTPLAIHNRIGLSSISYRVGDYADFRATLQAGLSMQKFTALGGLTTRDRDDFTLGLVDAFACVADVLTFYQERIANESYLGTARERLSLREMGRLIGYRLRPGVAAETPLAFTFESPPRPPAAAKPEPGMFVSGVPAEVTLAAGLAVRSVPPPGEQPQVFETVEALTGRPAWNALQPWLNSASRPLPGHKAAYLRGTNTNLRAGDALLLRADTGGWNLRLVDTVLPDAAADRTRVSWNQPLVGLPPPDVNVNVTIYALRRRAASYGHNAPAWNGLALDVRASVARAPARLARDANVAALSNAEIAGIAEWPDFELSPASQSVDLDNLYPEIRPGTFAVLTEGTFDEAAVASALAPSVRLFTITSATAISREDFGITARVTRLTLTGDDFGAFASKVRTTTVYAQAEPMALAEYPVEDPVAGDSIPVAGEATALTAGRRLLVRGVRVGDGVAVVHPVILRAVLAAGTARAWLEVDPPLPAELRRASVVVHANVALASHGETSSQILGAGNSAQAFQRFELRNLPLTYRAAANELGAAAELTVRVDDIAWRERDTSYGVGPRERVFTLVDDEKGRLHVLFGDGARGARPSSGTNNIRAIYRKGLGVAGNVAAETLTQLTQRPLGLKGVSNPLPATGGTDVEDAERARRSMPLMTRTLGRAVSLLDYEDFARAFSGVAKARAAVLQLSAGPVVAITIAGAGGAAIATGNPVWTNLAAALANNGDPHVAVRLLPHVARAFGVGLKIKCSPDHEPARVLAAVEAALRAAFGFDARDLGQPVQQSEVIATAQGVAGVIAVDLDHLHVGTQRSRQVRLLAARMHVSAGIAVADELLTLAPGAPVRIEEMP